MRVLSAVRGANSGDMHAQAEQPLQIECVCLVVD
jgi:hypothetical protein